MHRMKFYEVLVASQRFHGSGPLTYENENSLKIGQIVVVALQSKKVMGVVTQEVKKPAFKTKPMHNVLEVGLIPSELIELVTWLRDYYPAPLGQLLTLFLPSSLGQKSRKLQIPKEIAKQTKLPPLTNEQTKVVTDIIGSSQRMHLLHGETGTGKTRVYVELITKAFDEKKSAILLTPEIGLTSQLTETIEATFAGRVITLHSGLSSVQRRNRWQYIINETEPVVVIGPRSALFAPVHALGVIILDEAHDGAYKQEQAPYYQTTRVAGKLGELHKAKVVLGTATPLISDYFTFREKGLPIHRMIELAQTNTYSSHTELVSLKDKTNFTKSNWISTTLTDAIHNSLKNNTQSLIFLNRRGTARIVMCQSCGWYAACPNCDVTLTYHADSHRMQCHSCGYKATAPSSCPECKAADVTFKSVGTKAITSELAHLFPQARILRLDGDSDKSDKLENQYEQIKNGEINIIVGTQVIAKGLDLPKLGLVGVISADTGLNFPDYTAEERTFQLLTQVIGRAARGHRNTKVIVQTFNSENETIRYALAKDFEGFYKLQIAERQRFDFPPFKYVLKLRIERANSEATENAARTLVQQIRRDNPSLLVSDPSPSFIEKLQNRYRWQIIIKSSQRSKLLDVIARLPANVQHDIDPSHLL